MFKVYFQSFDLFISDFFKPSSVDTLILDRLFLRLTAQQLGLLPA